MKDGMLREKARHRKKNFASSHLYVKSKKQIQIFRDIRARKKTRFSGVVERNKGERAQSSRHTG
jgi:sensor domain CHASE-containing protein